jgi:excisionase family DNA binding protein
MPTNPLITISQASKVLGVSTKTLRRWEDEGKLSSIRTAGGHRRYEASAVSWLKTNSHKRKVTAKILKSIQRPSEQPYQPASFPSPLPQPVNHLTYSSTPSTTDSNPSTHYPLQAETVTYAPKKPFGGLLFILVGIALVSLPIFAALLPQPDNYAGQGVPTLEKITQDVLGITSLNDLEFLVNISSIFDQPVAFNDTISVAGDASLSANVSVGNSLYFTSGGASLSNQEDTYLVSSTGFSVGGGTIYYLDAIGNTNFNSGVYNGNLSVSGTSTLNGSLTANGAVNLGQGLAPVLVNGNSITIQSGTTISLQPANDLANYMYFTTSDAQPGLFFAGTADTNDPGIRLNTTSGKLEYRDENVLAWTSFDSLTSSDTTEVTQLFTDGGSFLYPASRESLRIYDSSGTDYIDIAHNGTNVLITTSGTGTISLDNSLTLTGTSSLNLPGGNTIAGNGAFSRFSQGIQVVGQSNLANTTVTGILDLSAILHDSDAPQGLKLPQNTDLLPMVGAGEGYMAYDTTSNQVLVFDGVNWNNISGASTTLQQAYEAGNSIDVLSGEGNLAIDLQSADMVIEVGQGSDTGDFRIWDGVANWLFIDESADSLSLGEAASTISLGTAGITTTVNGNLTVAERGSFSHGNNQGLNLPSLAGVPASVTGTTEGDVVWDSTNDALYVFDGSTFAQVGGGGYSGWNINVDSAGNDLIASGDSINIDSGAGISLSYISASNTLSIEALDDSATNELQNLFATFTADSGTSTADTQTDTLTISGGTNIGTTITGDALTINLDDSISLSGSITIGGDTISDFVGNGFTLSTNTLSLNLNNTGSVASGLTVDGNGLSLIRSCNDGEVLKWTAAGGWDCDTDTSGGVENFWAKVAGVLSPVANEPIAASSSAATVATFTSTGSNLAFQAGGASTYTTIDQDGNIVIGGNLTAADGKLYDLSAILHNDNAPQGLKLPQSDSLTAMVGSGEGYIAYNTSLQKVMIFNGTTWTDISGAATSLQEAYNNSTSPEITVDSTRGALTLRNNATPINAALFEVQNNSGSENYFSVDATGLSTIASATVGGTLSLGTAATVANNNIVVTRNATTGLLELIDTTAWDQNFWDDITFGNLATAAADILSALDDVTLSMVGAWDQNMWDDITFGNLATAAPSILTAWDQTSGMTLPLGIWLLPRPISCLPGIRTPPMMLPSPWLELGTRTCGMISPLVT